MKIIGYKLGKLRVPLVTPFKTALRNVDHVEDIVIMIETDTGHVGYGAAPATAVITGDTHGSIIDAIRNYIMPMVTGMEVSQLNQINEIIGEALINNFSAKAAVEIAVYDLFAQAHGVPLYKMLGGGQPRIASDITISVDYIDKMVADSIRAADAGYETLKIKVGKDLGVDIKRVKAIYAAVKDRCLLRLDANQGWTARETVAALHELESSGIELELIEQPVKGADLKGMKYITERVRTPVMADESTFGPREVIELIQMGAADIINIKLMKTGGLSDAIKIADIAKIYDVKCMIGCMLESSISVTAAAHLAVAKSSVITKVDLDGPALCQFNPVTGGATFRGPDIELNETPGLGIEAIENLIPLD
ncbi:dipeptide epimerase [Gimibacter soli]|uniref:Dipeptide epimerase n=1 Tax=Gimibacter soli TaxID=3024400 RepID=A0AAE9XX81_9PROT|nr:dipeptide epimerase [Gimibacter soli]WCL55239.1 dipeptide epimerase [Gimibacter soli]